MKAALMDMIEKAREKLGQLQQKHKLEIGSLAYKHNLQNLDLKQLDLLFAKIALDITS